MGAWWPTFDLFGFASFQRDLFAVIPSRSDLQPRQLGNDTRPAIQIGVELIRRRR